jgi:hypothetical protein
MFDLSCMECGLWLEGDVPRKRNAPVFFVLAKKKLVSARNFIIKYCGIAKGELPAVTRVKEALLLHSKLIVSPAKNLGYNRGEATVTVRQVTISSFNRLPLEGKWSKLNGVAFQDDDLSESHDEKQLAHFIYCI